MRRRIEIEEDFSDVVAIIRTITSPDRVELYFGEWPVSVSSDNRYFAIFLPLVKGRGEAFHKKLQMLAAHEAGHITFSHKVESFYKNSKKINLVEETLKLDDLEKWVQNGLEDVRMEELVEGTHLYKWLLPMSFHDFRCLYRGQVDGKGAQSADSIMVKMQFALMGLPFKIEEELEKLYTQHFAPEVKSLLKYFRLKVSNEESFYECIEAAKRIAALFRQLMPEQVGDKEGDESQERQEGDSQEGKGQPQQGGANSQQGSKKSQPSQGQSKSDRGQSQSELESQERNAQLKKLLKALAGELVQISNQSFDKVETDRGEQISEEELKELNSGLSGGGGQITYLQRGECLPGAEADRYVTETKQKYDGAVDSFRRLFSGGWRAPRKGIRTGREYGELDTDLLFKTRFKGRDRSVFFRTMRKQMPGLNILCLIDNSGSMSSYTSQIRESSILLAESVKKHSHNKYRMRIVFFTNESLIAKDWNTKTYQVFTPKFISSIQGGTPLDTVLSDEHKKFMQQAGDKFLVVVSDGQPSNTRATEEAITQYKKNGIYTLLLDFGGGSSVRNFDSILSYEGNKMSQLPKILSKDVADLIRSYARTKMRAVSQE